MTTTEQIVWAHRVDKDAAVSSRARRCASTRICCRPPTARRRSRSTRSTRSPAATRSSRARPRSPTTTSSSRACEADDKQTSIGREFARAARRSRSRTTRRPATASSISIFPSRAWCCPASSFPARTRTAAPTARTARSAFGVGSTTLGFGWSTGYIYFTLAQAAARRLRRTASAVGQRQGHRARAAAPLGREAVAGDVGRVRRRASGSCRSRTATRSRT